MTTPQSTSRTLSEIGHLFLSDLRQKQGGPRPQRTPPPSNSSPNPTHEEFERACQVDETLADTARHASSVTALLSSHLGDREGHWIRSYAAHLARTAGRVGLIEMDSAELKIACFDRAAEYDARAVHDTEGNIAVEPLDERRMSQAMEELAWDVDHWLLFVHAPRGEQGRSLLGLVGHWTLLATSDHEGVVAAYRTIKGLLPTDRPELSMVVLDAPDAQQAANIHQKLSGVCQKFLNCAVRAHAPLRHVADVQQTAVLHCRDAGATDPNAAGAHWKVIADFLSAMKHSSPRAAEAPMIQPPTKPIDAASVAPVEPAMAASVEPPLTTNSEPAHDSVPSPRPARSIPIHDFHPQDTAIADVLDLPEGESPELSILSAVLGTAGQFIRCPITPPECPSSIVAVSRDKRLTLLAVAGHGLSDLRHIATAFQWMRQNRDLIVMALPQFSIKDAAPNLRLLVDQADLSADLLHPFLSGGDVTIQPYRKLRWGRKNGLLLEAA